jgi:hypothetical protein
MALRVCTRCACVHSWITDDNLYFSSSVWKINQVLQRVHQLQVPIAQPSVKTTIHPLVRTSWNGGWATSKGHATSMCVTLLTDFVEIMTPIMRPCALFEVFGRALFASHRTSDYGLDAVWCRYLATLWNYPLERVCAVIKVPGPPFKKVKSNTTIGEHSYSLETALEESRCLRFRRGMHWSRCEVLEVNTVLPCNRNASALHVKGLPGAGHYPKACMNGPAPTSTPHLQDPTPIPYLHPTPRSHPFVRAMLRSSPRVRA